MSIRKFEGKRIWIDAEIIDDDTGLHYVRLGLRVCGKRKRLIVPKSALWDPKGLIKPLLDAGVAIPAGDAGIEMVEKLDVSGLKPRRFETSRCGWSADGGYVRPSFTLGNKAKGLHAREDVRRPCDRASGSSKRWRNGLRPACDRSSYLAFVIGTAFAGPLLELTRKRDGVVFNFYGGASADRSLIARATQSTYCRALENDIVSFGISEEALEELCLARNDLHLVINEEGAAGRNKITQAALKKRVLSIPSGQRVCKSKVGPRAPNLAWKIIAVSTSESPLEDQHAGPTRADAERFQLIGLRIPAQKCGGIYDRLDDKTLITALNKEVCDAIDANHGFVMRRYLEGIVSRL